MGTRSIIKFQEDGNDICAIYQQFDGYPECVGNALFKFLDNISIVNGIRLGETKRVANGVGCLAAQFIAEHKNGAGGLYLTIPKDACQQYNYNVNCKYVGEGLDAVEDIEITVSEYEDELFKGNLMNFGLFIDSYNDEENEVGITFINN